MPHSPTPESRTAESGIGRNDDAVPAGRSRAAVSTPTVGYAPLAVGPEAVPLWRHGRRRWLRRLMIAGTLVSLPLSRPVPAPGEARPKDLAVRAVAAEPRLLLLLDTPHDAADASLLAASGGETEAEMETVAGPAPMAQVQGVRLVVPADPEATRLVGFHEANGGTTEVLQPTAPLADNHNPASHVDSHDAAAQAPAHTPETIVLPSRGRGSHPASAVDVALPEGVEVLSPVTGRVVSVSEYVLYGRHPDTIIELEPAGRPDLRVVVLHVSDAKVAPGDRVVAGATPLAGTATAFPFSSQIDRFVAADDGGAKPHVHIEVKRSA